MTDRIHSLPSRLFFISLALLLLCAPLAPARSDQQHWIRVNSSHFSVVTDADEFKGHDVVARFEQMRLVFGQLLARTRINMSAPIDIIALRSDDEYSKVVPNRQGPAIAMGFFIPGSDRDYFVLNLSKEESWRAVSREFALVFLNYNYPPTQPWFDEGFAEYFSSLRFDNKQAQIGADPESFTEILNSTPWLSIPDQFATRRDASQESSRHTLFYAQSWIVMHYLLTQDKLSETGTYFDLVQNQKLPVEEAIQKAYGMSSAQFAQVVQDHFHSLGQPSKPPEKGKQPLPAGSQTLEVTPSDQIGSSNQDLPEAEGQSLVAEMSVRLPEHREQAVQQLESITAQPKMDNVVARRSLAWTHMEKKEFDRAVEELSKAGELNPKDPWLHYYLALVRYHLAQTGQATGGLPNMMQDLRQVLDWDPEFAQARAMLAMAQLEGGGVHAATDSMRVAVTLSPRNQTYLLNMAQIYMAGKSWEAATAVLERLKSSPDPQVAKSAGEELSGLPMLKKYGTLAQPQQTASASSPSPSPSPSSPTPSLPSPRSATAPSATAPSATSKKPAEPQPKTETQSPEPDEVTVDRADQPPTPAQPDKRAIQFLKGKLVSVDCSQAPSAILTVSAGAKVLKLRTPDYKSLTLIGADDFSCDWKGHTVAVNYRAGGKADGDLVSIEVQ